MELLKGTPKMFVTYGPKGSSIYYVTNFWAIFDPSSSSNVIEPRTPPTSLMMSSAQVFKVMKVI
jgi:hypothetical protein